MSKPSSKHPSVMIEEVDAGELLHDIELKLTQEKKVGVEALMEQVREASKKLHDSPKKKKAKGKGKGKGKGKKSGASPSRRNDLPEWVDPKVKPNAEMFDAPIGRFNADKDGA